MTAHERIILQAAAIIERIHKAEQQIKPAIALEDPQTKESAQNRLTEVLTEARRDRAPHEDLYPWIWFSPQEARAIVQAIAGMVEKSYGRGIQQGEAMKVSAEDAYWFRYECCLPEEKSDGLYRLSIPSPENGVRRKVHRRWWTCVDLLDRELPWDSDQKQPFAVLRRLVNWYQKKFGRDAKEKHEETGKTAFLATVGTTAEFELDTPQSLSRE